MDIPGYKIIDTLGQGSMATVYLAIQESFDREVALKVMAPALSVDPGFSERFLREARIAARLIHPNIVTVYDVGVHAGCHFLSMEYVPGRDLKHRRFELTLPQCLQVIRDIARALDYAGRKGYVHRGVKPENIMLHAEDGRAVLMDFGIARALETQQSVTQTGMPLETPYCMSPEQAQAAAVDHRADLYSLGVVMFLLLTGHVPYDADSAVALGILHLSADIPRLPEHLQVFQPLIDRALAKEPAQRYQSGAALIAALNAIAPADIIAAMSATRHRLLLDDGDPSSPTMQLPEPMILDSREAFSPPLGAEPGSGDSLSALQDTELHLSLTDEDRAQHGVAPPGIQDRQTGLWGLGMLLAVVLVSYLGFMLYTNRTPVVRAPVAEPALDAPAVPELLRPVRALSSDEVPVVEPNLESAQDADSAP